MNIQRQTNRNSMSFAEADAIGASAEAEIKRLLDSVEAKYIHHELPPVPKKNDYKDNNSYSNAWEQWKEIRDAQDKGDFLLRNNVYVEVKADAYAAKSGNLFLEMAEYNTADGVMKIVGFLKHLASPTIFTYRMGDERDYFWLVFTARDIYNAIVSNYAHSFFTWNESKWNGKADFMKLGFLIKGYKNALSNGTSLSDFITVCRDEDELLKAIRVKSYQAKKAGALTIYHEDIEAIVGEWADEWSWEIDGLTNFKTVWAGRAATPLAHKE